MQTPRRRFLAALYLVITLAVTYAVLFAFAKGHHVVLIAAIPIYALLHEAAYQLKHPNDSKN